LIFYLESYYSVTYQQFVKLECC